MSQPTRHRIVQRPDGQFFTYTEVLAQKPGARTGYLVTDANGKQFIELDTVSARALDPSTFSDRERGYQAQIVHLQQQLARAQGFTAPPVAIPITGAIDPDEIPLPPADKFTPFRSEIPDEEPIPFQPEPDPAPGTPEIISERALGRMKKEELAAHLQALRPNAVVADVSKPDLIALCLEAQKVTAGE